MKITEIDKNQALRYMGHKGEVPPVISEMVEKCEKLVWKDMALKMSFNQRKSKKR